MLCRGSSGCCVSRCVPVGWNIWDRNTLTNGAGLSARVGLQRQQAGLHLSTRCSLSQYSLITTVATEQAESGWLQSLYAVGQQADQLVQHQLAGVTSSTYVVVLAAGLLTSLSPCTLSVLPLTIGYIGGYSADKPSNNSILVGRAGAFALGLATTLALLGMLSSAVGNAYGQIGNALPLGVSLVAIAMGLNLLELLPFRLPSLDVDVRTLQVPPLLQAYAAGLTFALAASPCSTPVLATLLAYVSTAQRPLEGGALLLAYTTGYVAPLLVAATFTGALKNILALRQYSAVVTPASGVLLLAGGTFFRASRTRVPGQPRALKAVDLITKLPVSQCSVKCVVLEMLRGEIQRA
ncbi:hypothetical protein WJX82_002959 [Trebouxia sp. C0006]